MNKYHVYFEFANGLTIVDTQFAPSEKEAVEYAYDEFLIGDIDMENIVEVRCRKIAPPRFDLQGMCDAAMLKCHEVIEQRYEQAIGHQCYMAWQYYQFGRQIDG